MDYKIVHESDSEIAIYAYELNVSQADVPYQLQDNSRPPSNKRLLLYADSLTIDGNLVNPGMDITMMARIIHLNKNTIIDTGGAYPERSFLQGDLPLQKDTGFGAAGASGNDATDGLPSGNITFVAGSIEAPHKNAGTGTLVMPVSAWLKDVIMEEATHQSINKALAAVPAGFTLGYLGITTGDESIGFNNVELDKATVTGAGSWEFVSGSWNPSDRGLFITLSFPSLSLGGHCSFMECDLSSNAFAATATLHLPNADGWGSLPHPTQYSTVKGQIKLLLLDGNNFENPLTNSDIAALEKAFASGLASVLAPIIGPAVLAAIKEVSLTLLAEGGEGGRGQDGQNGINGKPGVDGLNPSDNGSTGGNAGSAGHSASGAAGGIVKLMLAGGSPATIVASSEGGHGGDPAIPGLVGQGGAGGQGVLVQELNPDPYGNPILSYAPSGKEGASGSAPQFSGAAGAKAATGQISLNGTQLITQQTLSAVSFDAVAQVVPLILVSLTYQANSLDHLNAQSPSDLAAVATRYKWLLSITNPFVADVQPKDVLLDATDIAVRRSINQVVRVELARISQGQNYFGDAFNWVPVLSMTALKARISNLLDIGKMIEDTYLAYTKIDAKIDAKTASLTEAQKHVKNSILQDEDAITKIKFQLTLALNQVKASLDSITCQQQRLENTEFEFKEQLSEYVLSQAVDCTFGGVLKALISIVELSAEAVSGIGEIAAFEEATTIFKEAESIVKIVKVVDVEVEAIQKTVEKVQSLGENDVDVAKIVVDEKKFDAFISVYLGQVPAAVELSEAVHQYFALIRTHNKLALAYTGLYIQRERLAAGVAHKNAELEAIAAQLANAKANEVLPEYSNFMSSAYWAVKSTLLRELYEFNRAYMYWSLIERPFLASDATIASLAETYALWNGDIDSFLEQTGPMQTFNRQVDITEADYPEAFALFAQTRKLNVMLDIRKLAPTLFAGMTHITAKTLKVVLPDVKVTTGSIFIELTHSGVAWQNSATDLSNEANLHLFTHSPRVVKYMFDYGNPGNTAGGVIGDDEQGFPGLSPFTMWQIAFDQSGNEWLDLTKIKTVSLLLTGTFL